MCTIPQNVFGIEKNVTFITFFKTSSKSETLSIQFEEDESVAVMKGKDTYFFGKNISIGNDCAYIEYDNPELESETVSLKSGG